MGTDLLKNFIEKHVTFIRYTNMKDDVDRAAHTLRQTVERDRDKQRLTDLHSLNNAMSRETGTSKDSQISTA